MLVVVGYAQETTVEDISELIELGLIGRHITDLVASGASLQSVKRAMQKVGVS